MTPRCHGFGKYEGRCRLEADTPAGIWCQRCERVRREHLSRQFDKVTAGFRATSRSGDTELVRAEEALVSVTDECHGTCRWSDGTTCPCSEKFWPTIEFLRSLLDKEVGR